MALKLPPGYVDLFTATTLRSVDISVIGVVTDYLPPSRSKGNDWMCSFSLTDDSNRGYRAYGDGLKVRFFRPIEAELPHIQSLGDLVLIRNIRAKDWSGMTILLSNRITTWVVFPMSSIPEKLPTNNIQLIQKKGIRTPPPTNSEIQYVVSLCNSQDRSSFKVPAISNESTNQASGSSISKNTASRQKFSLIKDLKVDMYYDLIGEVVKMFSANGRCELYLSDYTSNNLLYNYEWGRTDGEDVLDGNAYGHISRVSKKWQGPLGKMSLLVTLWSPHSEFAQEKVKEKDFIHLRNVHARRKDGSTLEGSLHTDRRYPDRVDVTILKDHEDDRVKDVLKRKRDYNKKFTEQSRGFVTEVRGQKRQQGDDDESVKKTKRSRRQRRQQGKKKQNDVSVDDELSENELKSLTFVEHKLNKNITCTHPSARSRPVSSILSLETTHAYTTPNHQDCILPFQNIRFKTTVRAIEYFPPKLEDFAVPHRVTEFDALDDDSTSENDGDTIASNGSQVSRQDVKWEWRFGLFLEDGSSGSQKPEERDWIKVYVANQDAEFLLKMDAVDLHNDPIALSQLREKLFILWGDLEERKTQAQVQGPPAEQGKKCASPKINLVDMLAASPEEKPSIEKPPNETCPQKPSQTPAFQCCIKEYGIRVPKRELRAIGGRGEELQAAIKKELDDFGRQEDTDEEEPQFSWQRSFQMFGTTIK